MVVRNILFVIALVAFTVAFILPLAGGSEGRWRLVALGLVFQVAGLLAESWGLP